MGDRPWGGPPTPQAGGATPSAGADHVDNPDLQQRLIKAINWSLNVLQRECAEPRATLGGTVYIGLGGIAFTFWRVHQYMSRAARDGRFKLNVDPDRLLWAALDLCDRAAAHTSIRRQSRVTFLEGHSGVLVMKALVLDALGRHAEAAQHIQEVERCTEDALALAAGECEVLYGRAGMLFSLLMLRRCFGRDCVRKESVQELVKGILEAGIGAARTQGQQSATGAHKHCLAYQWHGRSYLGAAHGIVGILQVLLLCLDDVDELSVAGATGAPDGYRSWIRDTLDSLLYMRFPSGNLPSSEGNGHDRLVQWCHGSPGLLMLLSTCAGLELQGSCVAAMEVLKAAAQKSAEVVWERGLLKKGLGLCHGCAGNGYSFLSWYRATQDAACYHKALQFAEYMVNNLHELLNVPDRPASLYEGLAGAVCFWMDVLEPEWSWMPGFELPVERA